MTVQAKLFCTTGPLAGTSFNVNNEATIGNSPGNTIQLTPAIISGKHARIFYDTKRNTFFIEDLKSRNGTSVDGVRVRGKERLERLNVITFAGAFDFIFQVVSAEAQTKEKPFAPEAVPAAQQPEPSGRTVFDVEPGVLPGALADDPGKGGKKTVLGDGAAIPPMPPVLQDRGPDLPRNVTIPDDQDVILPVIGPQPGSRRQEKPSASVFVLEVSTPQGRTESFTLQEGENVVGRESSCDICIRDASVSRKHAVIILKSGTVSVKDLGSKNHTYLSGERITVEVSLRSGTEIMFGLVRASLRIDPVV
jgi:pSer/pThr/pTyr-binding forkhead associated (FHA) protein